MSEVVPNRAGGRPHKFTPEVLAAVPAWRRLGASPEVIADVLGTTVNSLQASCSRAGISLRGHSALSSLTLDQWTRLCHEADRRHTPAAILVAEIIASVVDAGLFAAVLGDYDDLDTTGG